MIGTIIAMPITVFDIKGVPGNRRERIEAAVVGGASKPAAHMKRGSPPIRSRAASAS
jgi:hypothetical protein